MPRPPPPPPRPMVFAEIVGTLSFLQPQADDDIFDRLHYYYTTTFLLLTAVLISLKMFGGRPIECWLPAEYKSSWEDYTEMYCWARNTYVTAFEDDNLPEVVNREYTMVSYYQWVPFFLVYVAFSFYAPCLIWRLFYDKSGIRLKDIMGFANDKANVVPTQRTANIRGLSAHLSSVFKHRFRIGEKHPYHHKVFRIFNVRYYESYLTYLYLAIKCLFLMNVLTQMYFMSRFLELDSHRYYGYGIFYDLIMGKGWKESSNFPVVTYCDMQIRILGHVQRHTVQCVLVINIFTEKIFFILWLWYTMLSLISFGSILSWIFASIPFNQRRQFIARRLELADVNFEKSRFKQELDEFVRDYIKIDGIFVLRMITIHSGILMCTDIVDTMWDQFLQESGHATIREILEDKSYGDDYDRSASAGGLSIEPSLRRKTSVLVPLMSREDLHLDQSPTTPAPQFLRPPSSRMASAANV
ncbi:Innexin [Caenorhabditis elegans]|uniref:Innexin n=1 Tax=Caenorhabditis elegans TaxID=6239 RepID=G5EGL4_CAEEL|nr:Innexin [Caenorhabditis elegans]CBY25205.1 Innexin [Caenorhabditis elegans]|eukprot:NP_001251236.1 Innexin [Caenorhabditis elegans]